METKGRNRQRQNLAGGGGGVRKAEMWNIQALLESRIQVLESHTHPTSPPDIKLEA